MNPEQGYTVQELMAAVISREIKNGENINVGTLSPLPAAGCLLAREHHAPDINLAILGSTELPFTERAEFFDLIQRGGCDLFFLSGAQIDKQANINLQVIGNYSNPKVRLPGGAGSGMIYYMAGRTILFLNNHSPQNLVEKVDFITAPGSSIPGVFRRGYPSILVTPLGVFNYDRSREELMLKSIHPGVSEEELDKSTGWPLDFSEPPSTPPPTEKELTFLRTRVREKMLKIYPKFAGKYLAQNKT